MKANNGESNERIRFQSLASADLSARLKKKQTKVLIPQIVQIMFFGVLFLLGATSIVVSKGSLNCSVLVSFMTSLFLLIDPIQVNGSPSTLLVSYFICMMMFCRLKMIDWFWGF